MDETHTERFGLTALPPDFVRAFAAKIDDRGNAQLFQLGETLLFGLRAAVKNIVDFSRVVNSFDMQFGSVSELHDSRCRCLHRDPSMILREQTRRREKEEAQE